MSHTKLVGDFWCATVCTVNPNALNRASLVERDGALASSSVDCTHSDGLTAT